MWSWPLFAALVNGVEENVVLQMLVDADDVLIQKEEVALEGKTSYLSIDSDGNMDKYSSEEQPLSDNKYPHDLMPGVLDTIPSYRTQTTYEDITNSIGTLLKELSAEHPCILQDCEHMQAGTEKSGKNDMCKCPRAEWSACVLRAAGHDFMDYDLATGKGGSDGCVDLEGDEDNAGLAACLFKGEHGKSLNDAYANSFNESVSLADFLVIAAEAVMVAQRTTLPALEYSGVDFEWGRITATKCPKGSYNRPLPNPAEGCTANRETFIEHLLLSNRQVAALMGVHTLGRARTENSGFNGWWSDPQSSQEFNNNYYQSLVQKGWMPDDRGPGKMQWKRAGNRSGDAEEMMLNTDMCLLYQDRRAEDGDCCAWLMPAALKNGGLTKKSDIRGILTDNIAEPDQWCGFDATTDKNNFLAVQHWCCKSGAHTSKSDCYDSEEISNPTGMAAADVLQFAVDEPAWLDEFVRAWRLATQPRSWRSRYSKRANRIFKGKTVSGKPFEYGELSQCAKKCDQDEECKAFMDIRPEGKAPYCEFTQQSRKVKKRKSNAPTDTYTKPRLR